MASCPLHKQHPLLLYWFATRETSADKAGPSAGDSVSGGFENSASGPYASVSGGEGNTAGGFSASVTGGGGNTAGGFNTVVIGGQNITDNNIESDRSLQPKVRDPVLPSLTPCARTINARTFAASISVSVILTRRSQRVRWIRS
jgi:hypothetical protein